MNKEKIKQNLINLIKIDSRTKNEVGEINIPGINKAGEFIIELTKGLPIKWEKITETGAASFLTAKTNVIDKSKPVVLLSGHLDTVFSPDQVTNKEDGNKLYGSGTQDMKGSLITITEILRELHSQNLLQNIIISLSPEEEIATPHYQSTIEELAKEADYILVFESTLDKEVDAKENKRSIVVERKGFRQFKINLKGPGGHSGVITKREERISTNITAAELTIKINNLSDYEKDLTINIGLLKGGQAINVLAPSTEFFFETRFKRVKDFEAFKKQFDKLITDFKDENPKVEIEIESGSFFPPLEINKGSLEFSKLCFEVAKSLKIDLVSESRGGGSEASLFQNFNSKAKVLDAFGPRGEGQHTTSEYVFIDSVYQSIEFGVEVIKKLIV